MTNKKQQTPTDTPMLEAWAKWQLGNHGPWTNWHMLTIETGLCYCGFVPITIWNIEYGPPPSAQDVCPKCMNGYEQHYYVEAL